MTKKKIFFILFIVAVIVFGFFLLNGKRFKKTNIFPNDTQTAENSLDKENNSANNFETNSPDKPNIEVKPADCDNECKKFEDNDDELDYCQQVCGISEIYEQDYENSEGEVDEAGCQKQTGIKKDYCLKDLAISEDDSDICSQIQDNNIKKTCNNRFIEDLLEDRVDSPAEDY